jgi:hypothetical protein
MRKTSAAVLWASAFILGALVIITAGKMPENAAQAGMATTGTGGFSLMTSSMGLGPDMERYELLYVIDNQTQMLYVYTVDNAADRRIMLRGGSFLPNLFRVGRGG